MPPSNQNQKAIYLQSLQSFFPLDITDYKNWVTVAVAVTVTVTESVCVTVAVTVTAPVSTAKVGTTDIGAVVEATSPCTRVGNRLTGVGIAGVDGAVVSLAMMVINITLAVAVVVVLGGSGVVRVVGGMTGWNVLIVGTRTGDGVVVVVATAVITLVEMSRSVVLIVVVGSGVLIVVGTMIVVGLG